MFEGLAILPIQYRSPAPPTPFQRLAQAMLDDLFTVKDFAEKGFVATFHLMGIPLCFSAEREVEVAE